MKNIYSYKTKGKRGIEDYSGRFEHLEDAIRWYRKHGRKLEKWFKRKLILCRRNEPEKK